MTTRATLYCLLVTTLVVVVPDLRAQADSVAVSVIAPPGGPSGSPRRVYDVEIGRALRTIGQGDTLLLTVPSADTLLIEIDGYQIVSAKGGDGRHLLRSWRTAVPLNGSGALDYRITPDNKGEVGQWPLAVLLSSGEVLDVLLNGQIRGSTELRKGVKPNVDHVVRWDSAGVKVCEQTVHLPYNARRTYTCDPKTKKVQ